MGIMRVTSSTQCLTLLKTVEVFSGALIDVKNVLIANIGFQEDKTLWLRRTLCFLHKAMDLKVLMGIWRFTGSIRLQVQAVRSINVSKSSPSGNKLVGIPFRMSMKLTGKLNGTLVVQP
eukprot:1159636-Pelagomonas_calceolata.AAC.6